MANRFSSKLTLKGGSQPVAYAQILKTFKRVRDQGSRAHKKAIDAMNKAVFVLSQVYVPVDTERLKEGGYVSGEKGQELYRGESETTYVSYIVYPERYAVFVHECIGHFHEPPTSAKFISRAVDELWPELNRIGGEAYRQAFFFERDVV